MTDDKKTVAEGNQDANDEDIRKTPTEAAQDQPDAGHEDPAAPQAVPTPGASLPPPAPPVVVSNERSGSRSGMAALILVLIALLAIAGLSAAGYLIVQNFEHQRFALENRLDKLNTTVSELGVDSKGRGQWFDTMAERTRELERSLQDLQRAQNDNRSHQQRVDGALKTLAEQVQGGQHAWQRAEIEHLLLVANTRLQLQQDIDGAQIALKLADERLVSLANPAYFRVREQISRELTRLDSVERPDVQALALKLSSLVDQVDALEIQETARGAFSNELKLTTGPQDAPWHQRLWVSLNEAVGSLISVRRDVERREPLLPPDQGFYLKQNLRLQLESARLALLKQDSANFKVALRQADEWLQQYFNAEQASTRAARAALADLQGQLIKPALPDISGSLNALRAVGRDA